MQVITAQLGQPAYQHYIGRIQNDPLLVDLMRREAEHHMTPEALQDWHMTWWAVIAPDDQILALANATPDPEHPGHIKCGGNYEIPGYGRDLNAYPLAFHARQLWLRWRGQPARTYIFEQPLALHEQHGWQRTGLEDRSVAGHDWYELTWTP